MARVIGATLVDDDAKTRLTAIFMYPDAQLLRCMIMGMGEILARKQPEMANGISRNLAQAAATGGTLSQGVTTIFQLVGCAGGASRAVNDAARAVGEETNGPRESIE